MTAHAYAEPGRVARWLLLALLALAALLPRVLDLGGFVTHDEAEFWLMRSERFLEALQAGQFADTAITTHPGVTTMWLGSAGILLRRALLEWGLVETMPFPLLLALMRLPAALVHTAAVLVGYALLRRMFPFALAALAALLWATDPFLIGYSRLLHTDALAASFAALCLLAAAAYWHHTRHPGLLVLSAVCGALAVLSKSPALAVLPIVAGYGLWAIGYRLWAIGNGSEPITHHPSPITHHPSSITHHPSPITHHPSPITHHPSPITHHPSPITHHLSPITSYCSSPGASSSLSRSRWPGPPSGPRRCACMSCCAWAWRPKARARI
jgi:hypothetical protein